MCLYSYEGGLSSGRDIDGLGHSRLVLDQPYSLEFFCFCHPKEVMTHLVAGQIASCLLDSGKPHDCFARL